MSTVEAELAYVQQTLKKAEQYQHVCHVLNYDEETICPKDAMQEEGDLVAMFGTEAFKLVKSKKFIQAANKLYEHKSELDPLDQILADSLHREYMKTKNITPAMNQKFALIFNKAFVDWINAKKAADFSMFAPSLKKVREVNLKEIALREEKGATPYDSLVNDYDRGLNMADLDLFFNSCKERLIPLLQKIVKSPKKIRTDFLSRTCPTYQQEQWSKYLMDVLGFNFDTGAITTTEHPFTDGLGRHDVRITTHYFEDNFASSMYSVIHESGHALFEVNQPQADWDHYINGEMSMGQHESTSRFFENRIGRSKAFIHLIYPKWKEIFKGTFDDVSEEELYEAINLVQPSLIRTEADEFTYTFHIIIRFEIEKELVNHNLPIRSVPKLWKQKYKDYLGVAPSNDREGCLQDVHWASGFGYFPSYAIGNAYNAMYYNAMAKDMDIDQEVSQGHIAKIVGWMRDHVWSIANHYDDKTWIKKVTGRDFTPDDFLDYLDEKYSKLYELK
jgi:carboxypeptidase Taq